VAGVVELVASVLSIASPARHVHGVTVQYGFKALDIAVCAKRRRSVMEVLLMNGADADLETPNPVSVACVHQQQ
jgi:hypothetical protein